jgi:parallel beta-helix repeat protein
VVERVVIDNCLFGIDLKQSNDNTLRGNRVSSKVAEVGVRGDGLRLWYSHRNLIEGNTIVDSRDMVAWYSNNNIYRDNEGRRSRYSIHFMFANDNVVERNRFYDNAVGVYFMYTEGGALRNNLISHATGATGMAVGFKESSNTVIEGNEIIYCAVGIGSDVSPFQPDSHIWIRNNRFAFNGIGIQFNSELGGNIVTDNSFEGNLTHVVQAGRGKGNLNQWHGNHFDDYAGFDRNADGLGDTPYDAVRLCRPHLDRAARGAFLQEQPGAGTAGLPGAAGAVFGARADAGRQAAALRQAGRTENPVSDDKPAAPVSRAQRRATRADAPSAPRCARDACWPAACWAPRRRAGCRWCMRAASGCARPARWTRRTSWPAASSAASVSRCARCRPSSWPTWPTASVSACPTSTPASRPATSAATRCSASWPARPARWCTRSRRSAQHRAGAALAAKPILKAKAKDPEPTLNLKERIGVARLTRPETCLAVQGQGVKGSARGDSFKGRLRYMEVDRWKPIRIAEHPYDLKECDLCVRECPVEGAISHRDADHRRRPHTPPAGGA